MPPVDPPAPQQSPAPDRSTALGELEFQLHEAATRFKEDSSQHKNSARRWQAALIVLAAFTSIVSAYGLWQPPCAATIQFITIILTSASTAATSWMGFRNYRDLWRLEREVYYAVKDLGREINLYRRMNKATDEQVERWFQRLNEILSAAGNQWASLFAQQKASSPSGPQPANPNAPGPPKPPSTHSTKPGKTE